MRSNRGVGLLELVLAIAIFGLVASAVASLAATGLDVSVVTIPLIQAEAYAEEALTAVRTMQDAAWNQFTVATSGLALVGDQWTFMGENTAETLGAFTRRVFVSSVCRDAGGEFTTCPGAYTDPHAKQLRTEVSWGSGASEQIVSASTMLTNWASSFWTQTNWSGGSAQAIWSDATKYQSDDGNIEEGISGELTLLESGGSHNWPYTNAGDYSFDTNKIEIASGLAQLKASGGGGIDGIGATVDELEYDTSQGMEPDMLHVSGNVYLIAYRGFSGNGYLKTIDIDSVGNIGAGSIDSQVFESSGGREVKLVHVSGNVYAVAYRGPGNDGWVKSFSVTVGGDISNSMIDSLEFDTSDGWEPDLIQVGSGYFVVAYRGVSGDGFVKSFTIDGSGNIGNAVIDALEWDTADGLTPDIIQVGSGYYAVAYGGSSGDGFIRTFSISPTGVIGNATIDSLEFDAVDGIEPDIINISGTMYAVAYVSSGTDGFIATFTIDATGNIANTVTSTYEFDTSFARTPDIQYVGGTQYLIAYVFSGSSGNVGVKLLDITTGGVVTSVIDTLTFSSNVDLYTTLVNVGPLHWVVAYEGQGSDGFITTFNLTQTTATYPTDHPSIYPSTSLALGAINSLITFVETATKNGGEIYYQLSMDNGATWKFWNGAAWANSVGATDYNTADVVNTNISALPAENTQLRVKAFLESNGSQFVQLDNIQITWSGGTFAVIGYLISSAFNMTDNSPVEIVEWSEDVSACVATCDVKLQVRTAPDNAGSPGAWGAWYGATGAGTYFTDATGALIPTAVNGNQWVQYRAELSGNGTATPKLEEVRINYQ